MKSEECYDTFNTFGFLECLGDNGGNPAKIPRKDSDVKIHRKENQESWCYQHQGLDHGERVLFSNYRFDDALLLSCKVI